MSQPILSPVEEAYRRTHPKSLALWERARQVIPSGITHDIRYVAPFPIYVNRAQGSRKWDIDGHEYLDYWMGHGALFLGHCHPAMVKAVQEQVARGTHLGGNQELEVRWAEIVTRLVPSAEMVRFTMSGTEATHLALRLARSYTGKGKVVKFMGHFHGWHDGVVAGVNPPYDLPMSAGIPAGVVEEVILCPPNDIKEVSRILEVRSDIAAVIIEPGGGSSGTIPTDPDFLRQLRSRTKERGVLLIFDEVITGFRYAPGGAQEYYGVTPDLTALAKILAGGLPGGGVAGKREIMEMMAFREDPLWNRTKRVAHAGTYNANPLSAAAGIAMLEAIAGGDLQKRVNRAGEELRVALGEVWKKVGAPGCVYGESSIFHISLEESAPSLTVEPTVQKGKDLGRYHRLRCALITQGLDSSLYHGWISAVHTDEDFSRTVRAYEKALEALAAEGALGGSGS